MKAFGPSHAPSVASFAPRQHRPRPGVPLEVPRPIVTRPPQQAGRRCTGSDVRREAMQRAWEHAKTCDACAGIMEWCVEDQRE